MIWVIALFLVASVGLNILLIWYANRLAKELLFISDNIGDFLGVLHEYSEHTKGLYELELFYGDDTIKGLIEHTRFVLDEIEKFESVYSLTTQEEIDGQEDPDPEEEA